MRPSTPHYTSPADLRERLSQPRIQTGVVHHGAIRGFMFAVLFEALALLAAFAIWHFWR